MKRLVCWMRTRALLGFSNRCFQRMNATWMTYLMG